VPRTSPAVSASWIAPTATRPCLGIYPGDMNCMKQGAPGTCRVTSIGKVRTGGFHQQVREPEADSALPFTFSQPSPFIFLLPYFPLVRSLYLSLSSGTLRTPSRFSSAGKLCSYMADAAFWKS